MDARRPDLVGDTGLNTMACASRPQPHCRPRAVSSSVHPLLAVGQMKDRACRLADRRILGWPMHVSYRVARVVVAGLQPSFLREQHEPSDEQATGAAKTSTSITLLDGLRGIACLLVFNYHLLFTYTHKPDYGWGFSSEGNWSWHQLPFIHMLYSGHIMVNIFFVISGYVLSYKILRFGRNQDWEQAYAALGSSALRRGLRLYLPSLAGVACVFVAVRVGAYDFSTAIRHDGRTVLGTNEEHPPVLATWRDQFRDVISTVWALLDWWHWDFHYNNYNPHLWTIAIEFRSSMVLFMVLLALIRVKSRWRITIAAGLGCFFMSWSRWDVMLFIGGMILAEFDLICGTWETRATRQAGMEKTLCEVALDKRLLLWLNSRRSLWWAALFVGGYLGSQPNRWPDFTPGYRWLLTWVPQDFIERDRWWQAIGAMLMTTSIIHLPIMHAPFQTRFAQYFGKISYAFYIVHGPILHSLGYSLVATLFTVIGDETAFTFGASLLIAWATCLPISIWAADIFWRAIDLPSTRLSRRIEKAMLA